MSNTEVGRGTVAAEPVDTALKDSPVVMVTGPRQCGKATLVRDLVAGNREFITMDDVTVLAAAGDPTGSCGLSSEVDLVIETEVAH